MPLSHLTGTKEFWSIPFEVTPSVLVPRPETEGLVEKVLELSTRESESILDVGTGSGCIAVALAKELPRAEILAVDVSARALAVARRNAARQKVKHIEFRRSDLFSALRERASASTSSSRPALRRATNGTACRRTCATTSRGGPSSRASPGSSSSRDSSAGPGRS